MKNIAMKTAASLALLLLTTTAFAQTPACDNKCLSDIASAYLRDVAKQDFTKLPWADKVRYTENNVAMMIGDGFWGAGPGIQEGGLFLPDATTGNILWFGISTEHGQPAYHGLRLKVANKQISEVESYLGRKEEPEVFAAIDGFKADASFSAKVPAAARRTREQLIAAVDGYFNTKQQNSGQLFTTFSADCVQLTNGVNTTAGDAYWAAKAVQGCEAQMKAGVYKPVDRIRARRYPVVNEDTGVVVALSLEDHATRFIDYTLADGKKLSVQIPTPNSRGHLDVFKIENGAIKRIEGVSVLLPYYIHSLWAE
jgi:hypothetical protein